MKYISLFSGIGGFEIAIHKLYPQAQCLGFSEVDKFALQVYQSHYPNHNNLGNVSKITKEQIKNLIETHKGCDLLVGGFPCQNLTSFSRQGKYCNSDGLQGPKSGLFWTMLIIIDWIQECNNIYNNQLHIIIENNASMTNKNKEIITKELQERFVIPIFMTKLNGADFGVQTRRRLYWTTFKVNTNNIECEQTWDDILEPINNCILLTNQNKIITNTMNKLYKSNQEENILQVHYHPRKKLWSWKQTKIKGISRWQTKNHSSTTLNNKCIPITCTVHNCILIDNRTNSKNTFHIRYFEPVEIERLFFIPDGWVSNQCSKTRCYKLLGNTVITKVIEHILQHHLF